MFGNRYIAAVRSVSKLYASVSRTAVPVINKNYLQQFSTTPRFFSHSAPAPAQQELTTALQYEIDAEKRLEQENLGGSLSPSIPGFKITTNDAEVRLTKTHAGEEILVIFNVNHSVDVEDYETEDAPVPVALPPFAIEITKAGKRLCFHLELLQTEDQEYDFRVEEFYVVDAVKNDNEAVEDTVYASSGKYIDPTLHELLFVRYLEERGFTADFCRHLVEFATHYEHSQYVGLLENIKAFVSK